MGAPIRCDESAGARENNVTPARVKSAGVVCGGFRVIFLSVKR
jgi:hypothetical protein